MQPTSDQFERIAETAVSQLDPDTLTEDHENWVGFDVLSSDAFRFAVQEFEVSFGRLPDDGEHEQLQHLTDDQLRRRIR